MTDQLNERPYLLERVDEAAVVQVYADDFERLPLNEKRLIWHLYQAALAGRDIYYDQRYAHNLEMRATLEAIVRHPEEVAPDTLAEIVRYTKLFWINTGPYNFLTARKFVLRLDPAAFAAAAHAAARRGGRFPVRSGRNARRPAAAPAADVLRPRLRADGHEQDAGRGPRHARREREQPVSRRHDGRSRSLRRAVRTQLAPGEAERPPHRRGLPHRRQIQRVSAQDRRAPGSGAAVLHAGDDDRRSKR